MLLQNKVAVIYGAGGSMGSAVARGFANEGAHVFLTGRSISAIQKIANEITAAGGKANFYKVDAHNEDEINEHLKDVIKLAGKIDISFNAVGIDNIQNIPLVKMSVDEYVRPATLTLQTRFLTAKAAGNIMMNQRFGVIISLTATPGGIGYPFTGGFSPACAAVENLCVNLAAELGIYGVRAVNIRSGGSPDSKVFKNAIDNDFDNMKAVLQNMYKDTMLKKLPLMNDIANSAIFLASDMATNITGVTIDVTGGTTTAINYRINK